VIHSIDLRRKYFIDPLTVAISAIVNQIIKDWPDMPRIISSVDQVRTFAGGLVCGAWFQENEELLKYANNQPLAEIISCLGDGHQGIWNIMAGIKEKESRREVLDWYHLMENMHKVGGSEQRLKQVRKELWEGNIEGAKKAFSDWENPPKEVLNFLIYLDGHKGRIPNYQLDQKAGLCIGSGEVESTIKRIGRRIKISGAQWDIKNLSNVLKQRCAYINNDIA
jgi:hypothetical protein